VSLTIPGCRTLRFSGEGLTLNQRGRGGEERERASESESEHARER